MSNRPNRRRGEGRRSEHGSHWENLNRVGRNTSRARRSWKRVKARAERRTGQESPKVRYRVESRAGKPSMGRTGKK